MLRFIPEHACSILDVGCGAAAFSMQLMRSGRTVVGVEPNAEAAAAAAQHLSRVLCSDIDGAWRDLPAGGFEVIVFNDVLEHLADPWAVLRRARAHLAPGGCVVASIPNVRHVSVLRPLLVDGLWDYQAEGILDRTHLRFFTAPSIRTLFEDSGYRIDSMEGINPSTIPFKFKVLLRLACQSPSQVAFLQYAVRAQPS